MFMWGDQVLGHDPRRVHSKLLLHFFSHIAFMHFFDEILSALMSLIQDYENG